MTEEEEQKIRDYIDEVSIESIVEVYIKDNCYMPLVQVIMDNIDQRLEKLNKLEEVFRRYND